LRIVKIKGTFFQLKNKHYGSKHAREEGSMEEGKMNIIEK